MTNFSEVSSPSSQLEVEVFADIYTLHLQHGKHLFFTKISNILGIDPQSIQLEYERLSNIISPTVFPKNTVVDTLEPTIIVHISLPLEKAELFKKTHKQGLIRDLGIIEIRELGKVFNRSENSFTSQLTGEIDLTKAYLRKADLKHANLSNADLMFADLNKAYLQNVDLRKANLRYASLIETNLQLANLNRANLRNANLQYADLWKADLYLTSLEDANLSKVNLQGANFGFSRLRHANLKGADLEEATLWEANLKNANLEDTNLCKTDLRGAYLNGANLNNAILSNALILESQIEDFKGLGVDISELTIIPDNNYKWDLIELSQFIK